MHRLILLLAAVGAALTVVLLASRRPDRPSGAAAVDARRAVDPRDELAAAESVAERAEVPAGPREALAVVEDESAVPASVPRGSDDEGVLRGHVVFPPGTPAGEEVTIVLSRGRPEQRVAVAADGSFRTEVDLERSGFWIQLEAAHLFLGESVRVRKDSGGAPIVLEPQLGGRIAGRVLAPSEEPLRGRLELVRLDAQSGTERLDLDGDEFTFEALPEGRYRLAFDGRSFQPNADEVTVVAGRTTVHELELRRGVTVAGRVVDGEGRAVRGATVAAADSTQTGRAWEGDFSLAGLPPGDIVLTARAPGFVEGRFELGELADGEERRDVELPLSTGNVIAGRVVWLDGTPADASLTWEVDGEGPDIAAYAPERRTGPGGTFRIAGLGSEPVTVLAEGSRARAEATVETPDGELAATRPLQRHGYASATDVQPGTHGLVLVLHPRETLRGRLVDERGEPVKAARVRARRVVTESGAVPERSDFTALFVEDREGAFAFEDLLPGTYEIEVRADGFEPADRGVRVPSSEPVVIVLRRRAR